MISVQSESVRSVSLDDMSSGDVIFVKMSFTVSSVVGNAVLSNLAPFFVAVFGLDPSVPATKTAESKLLVFSQCKMSSRVTISIRGGRSSVFPFSFFPFFPFFLAASEMSISSSTILTIRCRRRQLFRSSSEMRSSNIQILRTMRLMQFILKR